jgi:hypothetical protein
MIKLLMASDAYCVGNFPLLAVEDLQTLKVLPLLGYQPDELWLVPEQEYNKLPAFLKRVPSRVRECNIRVTVSRPNRMQRKLYRRSRLKQIDEFISELVVSLYPSGFRKIRTGCYRIVNPWLSLREVNDFRKERGLALIQPPPQDDDLVVEESFS